MISKENKKFRKIFIVADLASLKLGRDFQLTSLR